MFHLNWNHGNFCFWDVYITGKFPSWVLLVQWHFEEILTRVWKSCLCPNDFLKTLIDSPLYILCSENLQEIHVGMVLLFSTAHISWALTRLTALARSRWTVGLHGDCCRLFRKERVKLLMTKTSQKLVYVICSCPFLKQTCHIYI